MRACPLHLLQIIRYPYHVAALTRSHCFTITTAIMPTFARVLCTLLKLVPLGIYVRAACCKFDMPILGCDEPLCPVVLGEPAVNGCTFTGNSLELRHACETGWVPWLNGILQGWKIDKTVVCSEADSFQLLRLLGAAEILGWVMLWILPQFGALWLTVFMGFGLHFHLKYLNDNAKDCGLQLGLFIAAFIVLCLENYDDETKEAPKVPSPAKKKKAAKAD